MAAITSPTEKDHAAPGTGGYGGPNNFCTVRLHSPTSSFPSCSPSKKQFSQRSRGEKFSGFSHLCTSVASASTNFDPVEVQTRGLNLLPFIPFVSRAARAFLAKTCANTRASGVHRSASGGEKWVSEGTSLAFNSLPHHGSHST